MDYGVIIESFSHSTEENPGGKIIFFYEVRTVAVYWSFLITT